MMEGSMEMAMMSWRKKCSTNGNDILAIQLCLSTLLKLTSTVSLITEASETVYCRVDIAQ